MLHDVVAKTLQFMLSIKFEKSALLGILIPIVLFPDVIVDGHKSDFSKIKVSPPGRYFSINS